MGSVEWPKISGSDSGKPEIYYVILLSLIMVNFCTDYDEQIDLYLPEWQEMPLNRDDGKMLYGKMRANQRYNTEGCRSPWILLASTEFRFQFFCMSHKIGFHSHFSRYELKLKVLKYSVRVNTTSQRRTKWLTQINNSFMCTNGDSKVNS